MDVIDGIEATLIDNGMPVVVMRAADLGMAGSETREELEANAELKARLESIRLKAGPMMNLGDVAKKSVPKMSMVSAPSAGGSHFDAHLHSASLPRLHRRAGRGERGDRLHAGGLARGSLARIPEGRNCAQAARGR